MIRLSVKTIGDIEPDIGIVKMLGEDSSHAWGPRIRLTEIF